MTVVPFPRHPRRVAAADLGRDGAFAPLRPAQDLFALVPPGAVTVTIVVETDGATLARISAEADLRGATTEELVATAIEAAARRRLWPDILGEENPAS